MEPQTETSEAERSETERPCDPLNDRQEVRLVETYMRNELAEEGYDLPELAETMEEADARASASSFLFVLRNIKRDVDANAAEFTVLQDFSRTRHVARQKGLIAQIDYLRERIRFLFGFMKVTGKKKSLNLVGGRVGMRGKPHELVVDDDEAVIAWASQSPDYYGGIVKMKPQIDRKALRAHVCAPKRDPSIPMPPGVRLEERPDEFFATPATD